MTVTQVLYFAIVVLFTGIVVLIFTATFQRLIDNNSVLFAHNLVIVCCLQYCILNYILFLNVAADLGQSLENITETLSDPTYSTFLDDSGAFTQEVVVSIIYYVCVCTLCPI